MRLVSPEYEVIELHVLRAEWVARNWLSTLAGVEQYPIQVPSWEGLGYLKDDDGTVLMHLREHPRATLRPGQRVHVISCNCKPGIKKNKCRTCKCGKHGVPCSKLCKCKLSCGEQRIPSDSHGLEIEREGDTQVSAQGEHLDGDEATVAHGRPEEQHMLSSGISGDEEDVVLGEEATAMDDSMREVDDSVSTASVEYSNRDLFGFGASDIAEYSTCFEGGSHSGAGDVLGFAASDIAEYSTRFENGSHSDAGE